MFIASLFKIANVWCQLRYPSVDRWRKKMWYYSTIKKDKIILFAELEIIMLSLRFY
jgi:hypothetical protein